jgi:hypothetical protein
VDTVNFILLELALGLCCICSSIEVTILS